jgi:hypothetical protein
MLIEQLIYEMDLYHIRSSTASTVMSQIVGASDKTQQPSQKLHFRQFAAAARTIPYRPLPYCPSSEKMLHMVQMSSCLSRSRSLRSNLAKIPQNSGTR